MTLTFNFTPLSLLCISFFPLMILSSVGSFVPFLIHHRVQKHCFHRSTADLTQVRTQLMHSTQHTDDLPKRICLNATYSHSERENDESVGLYRSFADYAWSKLVTEGLVSLTDAEHNSKDSPLQKIDSSFVRIHIVSAHPINDLVIRYARYALLETIDDSNNAVNTGTHVLNFAIFPQPSLSFSVPILGIDLVTLPGGKNLCAIDFQPILSHYNNTEDYLKSWPGKYILFEQRLKSINDRFVKDRNVTWGGDIPNEARRFFSPYALWTRFRSDEGDEKLQDDIYPAFCAYVDLYIELLLCIKRDLLCHSNTEKNCGDLNATENQMENVGGQSAYLRYRQDHDPARPMLRRLYGEAWTENVIKNKLFPLFMLN